MRRVSRVHSAVIEIVVLLINKPQTLLDSVTSETYQMITSVYVNYVLSKPPSFTFYPFVVTFNAVERP